MTRKYTAFTKAFKLETLQSANQANVCIASLVKPCPGRAKAGFKKSPSG
jgi:hypothetical protein